MTRTHIEALGDEALLLQIAVLVAEREETASVETVVGELVEGIAFG